MVYHGSYLFSFLADYTGIPLDQMNFMIAEFVALISGLIFRSYLKPCPQNTLKRHLVALLWGILLGHFCFGRQMWHLFFQSFVSYFLLLFVPRKYVHLVIFGFSMIYLSGLHIYRVLYDYGNYTLDITSPFMISTQKLTAFAFAYYDGMRPIEKLTTDQREQAINDFPHIIEFLSYIFNFQGIIVGPLCFYQDYIDFISGNSVLKHKNKDADGNGSENIIVQPDNKVTIIKKLLGFFLLLIIFFKFAVHFPVVSNLDEDIMLKPIWYRIIYMWTCATGQRVRYYIAWTLADIVNNASGFGFNGYDDYGKTKWNLLTNIYILRLEFSTSLKIVFDSWNVQTQIWLKRICYDRLPTFKTLGVFVLSAVWHGFYPGYYFAFVTGAFAVYAGRGIRRKIRPLFQKNPITKFIYSIITWLGTTLTLAYAASAFDLMEFWLCFKFYNSFYWFMTIIVVLLAIILPGGSTKKKNLNKPIEIDNNQNEKLNISKNTDDNTTKSEQNKDD